MGREFTNALQQTPLWKYALRVYPVHQATLLAWQDHSSVNVNDIIALAYCRKERMTLPENWWQDARLMRVRSFILRLRNVRRATLEQTLYGEAKTLELNAEGIDIMCLQQMLEPGDSSTLLTHYEFALGIKKGALAPLIENLISAY